MNLDLRTCKVCSKTDYLINFPKSKKNKLGGWYRRHKCNTCYISAKKNYRQRKRDWFISYKENLSCSCCGYSKKTHKNFSTWALEFHHHDNNKSNNVANMINSGGCSIEKIKKEIEKCVVLCCRCHRESHGLEMS